MKVEPIGRLHLERIDMTPVGVERGELVHSVPLAPRETVHLSHKEWSVRSEEFEQIVQDQFEGFSEEGVVDKTDIAHSTTAQAQHSRALNLSASASGGYGTVTMSASVGYAETSGGTQSLTDSRNHSIELTRKASARTRKDHKVSFKVSSSAGTEDQAVRTITNPSDTDTMRVDYYQLMRKWRVDLYRYGLRMTYDIVIPSPGSDLIQKIEELESLKARIDSRFSFPVAVADITRDTWMRHVERYGAAIDPPPPDRVVMRPAKQIPWVGDTDSEFGRYDAIQFEVDLSYELESARFYARYDRWDQFPLLFEVVTGDPGGLPGASAYEIDLPSLQGLSNTIRVGYKYAGISTGQVEVSVTVRLKPQSYAQWQYQTWSALRQAAEDAYVRDRQALEDQQSRLEAELGEIDALSLRRMEREEIMKGVLRWLFGPAFDFVPADIAELFASGDAKDPKAGDVLDVDTLDNTDWMRVMERGEFIKFIHQAIEWENALFFTYPYFWDSERNWQAKRWLKHPDLLHRMFLRAGAARVVLTIRPGFEEPFTRLVELGAFSELPKGHPYVSIAEDIRAFAKTNYPGIPPANPASDDESENAELGTLIARWHEYTPTSALDISLNTATAELA